MSYFIEFEPLAKRQFKKLTPEIQNLILQKLEKLKLNPRLGNIKKLIGEDNAYRLRVGNYRVIYEINNNTFSYYYYPSRTSKRSLSSLKVNLILINIILV